MQPTFYFFCCGHFSGTAAIPCTRPFLNHSNDDANQVSSNASCWRYVEDALLHDPLAVVEVSNRRVLCFHISICKLEYGCSNPVPQHTSCSRSQIPLFGVSYLETTDSAHGIAPPSSAHRRARLSPEIAPEDKSDVPESDGTSMTVAAATVVLAATLVSLLTPALSAGLTGNGRTASSANVPHKKPRPRVCRVRFVPPK